MDSVNKIPQDEQPLSNLSSISTEMPNKTNLPKINQLNLEVTRKICTGQVVISLAGACRELIDNALDAGATNIEIRTKENGTDYLEVIDNGCGIAEENFDLLCKPHSTSKLSAISDFNFLSTFGFRGEALNALAALGEITITTRHVSSKIASRLRFDRNGSLTSKDLFPRQVGTTVCVANLFITLPVRRQEFVRNARREFLKMLSSIQSFALSRIDCRFNCSNQANGKKVQMLSTPGNCVRLKEVISSLFGVIKAEKGASILDIEEVIPDVETMALFGIRPDPTHSDTIFNEIKLSGYVSSCEFSCGRNSPDRQFTYVNKRPVDFAKLNRIVNEVYTHFNRGHYCMLVLFVDVDPAKLDVNVSPDKRTVFLQNEKELFAKLRASLWHTFSKVNGNCRRGDVAISGEIITDRTPSALKLSRSSTELEYLTQMSTDEIGPRCSRNELSFTEDLHNVSSITSNSIHDADEEDDDLAFGRTEDQLANADRLNVCHHEPPSVKRARFDVFEDVERNSLDGDSFAEGNAMSNLPAKPYDEYEVIDNESVNVSTLEKSQSRDDALSSSALNNNSRSSAYRTLESFEFRPTSAARNTQPCTSTPLSTNRNSQTAFISAASLLRRNLINDRVIPASPLETDHQVSLERVSTTSVNSALEDEGINDVSIINGEVLKADDVVTDSQPTSSKEWMFASRTTVDPVPHDDAIRTASSLEEFVRPEQILEIGDFAKFRKMVLRRARLERNLCRQQVDEAYCEINVDELLQTAMGRSDISESDTDKRVAEERLNLMLKKSDFFRMEVVGQFNNAFIFARLDDEMFMIDQHASDEKFNFERFKRRSQISTQKLINSKPLELGAVEESVLRDNIDIFRANGFDFSFNDDGENGRRVMLISVPVLHGWQFDNSDIEEIVGVLTDFPGVMYRPAKLRKIFASRACRKSVMFGTALTKQQMDQIVRNMGTMEQPWNCPHGRPTIRHLCTIKTQ